MKKLFFLCLLAFSPVSLANADLKVAVIDLGKAFDSFYKTKDASTRLQEKASGYRKEVQDLVAQFQTMQTDAKKLQDQSQDPALSAAARAEKGSALKQKAQDLMEMQNKLKEMETERGNELQDEKMRRHQEIVTEISNVISAYAGPQGYDLVLDKSSQSAASGVPIVLFNSSKLVDITADIIKQLNASAPVGGPAPTGAPAPAPAPSGLPPAH